MDAQQARKITKKRLSCFEKEAREDAKSFVENECADEIERRAEQGNNCAVVETEEGNQNYYMSIAKLSAKLLSGKGFKIRIKKILNDGHASFQLRINW